MATFKVGQRVRCARATKRNVHLNGREVVITHIPARDRSAHQCTIMADGHYYSTEFHFLDPLTDPGVDAFIESIKRLKPLHEEPKVERVSEYSGVPLPKEKT